MAGENRRQTLGDYFTLQRGVTYKSRLLGLPGPVLLGLATIQRNGGFRTDSLKTYGGECPAKLLVQPGELYLSLKDVTQSADLLGAVARLPRDHAPGRLTQDTVKLEPKAPNVPLDYLYWLLRTPQYRGYCRSHATGTTNLGLAREDFLAFPAPEPTPNQQKIVDTLSALDDKIELNRRMNQTLEAIARAIFKSWFVDFDPVRAKASGEPPDSICRRLRLTPDLLALFPDRLVDSELGEIPEGWVVKAVEDVAKVVKGKSYKSSELSPSKTALVTLKSFNRGGGYRLDGLKEYTGSYKSGQEVIGGDLVVAYTDVTQAADVIGKPALVISDSAYDHLVISLDVAVVRPVRDEYRVYLYGVMSGVEFQQHTRAHATGTTVLHLASNAVPGFKFIFPGEALVDFYATIAAPMFASIDERVAEGRTLASLRDTLLPKLLSGELCVPVNPEQIEEMI